MLDTSRTIPIPTPISPKWGEKASRYFVDAVGATAWDESYSQTLGYRWKGEDTLTWGNADEWILLKWLVQRFFASEQLDYSDFPRQEESVWAVVRETRIALLETKYTFRNPTEIKKFLLEHTQILSVLWDARPVIEQFFGNRVTISLEIVNDPEATNVRQLFGYIRAASLSPDEAFERLSTFDDMWFLKHFDLTGGLFNFNLE